jgi:CubicO group peptidase (beta-lactamase class C family)
MYRIGTSSLLLSLLTISLHAEAPSVEQINMKMQSFVDSGEVSGVVTMVVGRDRVLHHGVGGLADLESKRPMRGDSIFWIASMSKPVTAVAVLMLVDQGQLSLDDSIDKYIPAMSQLRDEAGMPVQITIGQLLSHTSGMAELESPYTSKTLAEATEQYAKVKILFPPGSKWQYSQTSINTAARIVEIVSGKTLDVFLEEHIFRPLGMIDTTFYLSSEQLDRLATSYSKEPSGELKRAEIRLLAGKKPTDRDRMPAGNGGLFSTATDYGKFCQMLLGEGEREGVRLLKPETVKTMRTIMTGELKTGFTPGNGWGVGVCVVREPQGISSALSPGSFGHGGAYGTQAWIDPSRELAYILMIQRSNLSNADNSDLRGAFQNAARSLVKDQP